MIHCNPDFIQLKHYFSKRDLFLTVDTATDEDGSGDAVVTLGSDTLVGVDGTDLCAGTARCDAGTDSTVDVVAEDFGAGVAGGVIISFTCMNRYLSFM